MKDQNNAIRVFYSHTDQAYLFLSADLTLLYVNEQAKTLIGSFVASPLQVNQPITDSLPARFATVVKRTRNETNRCKEYTREILVTNRFGEQQLLHARCKAVTEDGSDYFAVFVTDVTNVVNSQFRLSQLEKQINRLLAQDPDGLMITDEEGRIIEVNPACVNLLGVADKQQLLRKKVVDFLPVAEQEKFHQQTDRIRHQHKGSIRFRIIRNKRPCWLEVRSVRYRKIHQGASFFVSSLRDITSIKKQEDALRDALRQLEKIMESSMDVICVIDTNGIFRQVSQACTLSWGYHPKEVIGRSYHDLVAPADRKKTMQAEQVIKATGEIKSFENRVITKSGTPQHTEWSAKLDENNGLLYCIARDISEQKKIESTLVISEKKYRSLFDKSPIPKWLFDKASGRFLEVNESALLQYGYTRREFMALTADQLRPPEDIPLFRKLMKNLNATAPQQKTILRHRNKKGDLLLVESTYHLIEVEGREAVLCVANDITQKLTAEKELKKINERYRLVHKATFDAIWEWEVDTDVLYFGEGYASLFGYEKPKENWGDWIALFHAHDREKILEKFNAVVFQSEETLWMDEYRIRKQDGSYAYVRNRCIVLRSPNGQPLRLVGALQDISVQKEHEHSLLALNRKLTEQAKKLKVSNRELENFAYIASHDLQEPLRSVSTFVQLLQKRYADNLDEKAKQYIGFAVDGAEHMRKLIVNMLEYSRVDADNEPVVLLDANLLVDQVRRTHRTIIDQTGGAIVSSELPIIRGRSSLLGQLFQNLIGNAIKYRSDLPPRIEIGCVEKKAHWLFYVRDNGIGISEEFFSKIFEMFQRLHARDEFAGTGIGLAICKKIVNQHGGEIWVKSAPGKGSTFLFTLQKNYD